MGRRQPGFGQPPLGEELAQVTSIGPVGLGPPLVAAPGGRLGRLGQVRDRAGAGQLLADEQPAGCGLERNLDLLVGEALDPGGNGGATGLDPAAAQLARLAVQGVEGDLSSVHVEPGYYRHWASFELRFDLSREGSRAEPRGALLHAIFTQALRWRRQGGARMADFSGGAG